MRWMIFKSITSNNRHLFCVLTGLWIKKRKKNDKKRNKLERKMRNWVCHLKHSSLLYVIMELSESEHFLFNNKSDKTTTSIMKYNQTSYASAYTYDVNSENFTHLSYWPNAVYEFKNSEDAIHEFNEKVNLYYTPLLSVTGSVGNIISVFVFFRTRLKKLSSSYYLSALCISDTGFLLVNFLLWLSLLDIHIYNENIYCQAFTFLSSFCSALSVWFVVAFTIERFIAVMYPLKRQTMCTVKRAKSVLIGLIIVSIFHSFPLLILSAPSTNMDSTICDIRIGFEVRTS